MFSAVACSSGHDARAVRQRVETPAAPGSAGADASTAIRLDHAAPLDDVDAYGGFEPTTPNSPLAADRTVDVAKLMLRVVALFGRFILERWGWWPATTRAFHGRDKVCM